jgi:hypothetical protein
MEKFSGLILLARGVFLLNQVATFKSSVKQINTNLISFKHPTDDDDFFQPKHTIQFSLDDEVTKCMFQKCVSKQNKSHAIQQHKL